MIELIRFWKNGKVWDVCPARWYSNPKVLQARMDIQEIDSFEMIVGFFVEDEELD